MTALARGRLWLLVAGAAVLHVSTAWRYGYFRDELYFIACAKHLAWGYVDQPPLVAVAAWLAGPAGYQLLALRALPALAAALTVLAAVQIVRTLGGGAFAQVLTALTVGLMPAYLALGNILTTTSFEGLSWTLVALLAVRLTTSGADLLSVTLRHEISRHDDDAALWVALAVAVAFGLYGKYSIGLFVISLLAGLLLTSERRVLATFWFPIAAALTGILVAPNLIWQGVHGWPFLTVLAGDAAHRHAFNNGLVLESRDFLTNTLAYLGEQLLYTNPVAAPIWLAGAIAPFRSDRLREVRFIAIAFVLLVVAAVALEAKGYYTVGIYATLFAIGSVAVERAAAWFRITVLAATSLVALAVLPISLPVLPIDGFIAYSKAIGLAGQAPGSPELVQPLYAEQFGWEHLVRDVASVYNAIPERERATVAVYADTYADAGAIDFFGESIGLPPAISSQNTYWLWGTNDYHGTKIIAVGASRIDVLKKYYRSCTLVKTSTEPLKAVVEGPSPIFICTNPSLPFEQIWQQLRWYGA
jgi:hypothetical protein